MKGAKSSRKRRFRSFYITDALVSANVLAFIALLFLSESSRDMIFSNYAFSLTNVLEGKVWTPITSMFLHGNLVHLLLNMISLFFFGRALETEITQKKFVSLYFIGGIAASIFSVAFTGPAQLSVGASGAIFAVIAAAMIVKPFEFVAFPYVLPIPIILVAVIMLVSNILLLVSPPEGTNISFSAHIGGFIAGMVFGFREKGMRRSMTILAVALVLFMLISQYIGVLSLFDYTRYLQRAIS